jgi:hypothetical protein
VTESQLPDVTTQLTIRGVVDALRTELPAMPSAGVLLLAAHVHLETGLRACHCFNVGNAKWTTGCGADYCMFACGEEVTVKQANELRNKDPGLISFVGSPYIRNGHPYQSIRVSPPHPWSRFRAFRSLQAGVADHIRLLRGERYRAAWATLTGGLPGPYAAELAKAGYFTADPGQYARTLRERLLKVRGNLLGKPTLRPGGKPLESAVRECQALIGAPVTGLYDVATVAAVRKWQTAHGLGNDGTFGDMSWCVALPAVEALL